MIPTLKTTLRQRAQSHISTRPVYLDTETTGLGSDAEIVEICILDHAGNVLINQLVKPRKPIPADATRVHGITNALVTNAPTWAELWPRIATTIAHKPIGIYNAEYDTRLIRQSCYAHSIGAPVLNAFCIMELYAEFYGEWNDYHGNYKWQALDKAAAQCGLVIANAHRAESDARTARAVLHHMADAESAGIP